MMPRMRHGAPQGSPGMATHHNEKNYPPLQLKNGKGLVMFFYLRLCLCLRLRLRAHMPMPMPAPTPAPTPPPLLMACAYTYACAAQHLSYLYLQHRHSATPHMRQLNTVLPMHNPAANPRHARYIQYTHSTVLRPHIS
jgi:hypothetical protein